MHIMSTNNYYNNKNKYCTGCIYLKSAKDKINYKYRYSYCNMSPSSNDKKCPCVDCILKANCSNMCDARHIYREEYMKVYIDS